VRHIRGADFGLEFAKEGDFGAALCGVKITFKESRL
jgi:hypothetical protein